MRKDNLHHHLQGYGDFFRGVDNPPKEPLWAVQDYAEGRKAAEEGVAVSADMADAWAAMSDRLEAAEQEAVIAKNVQLQAEAEAAAARELASKTVEDANKVIARAQEIVAQLTREKAELVEQAAELES